jgi:hypothetical protein
MIIQNMLGDDFENHDFTHRRYRQEWLQVGCICGERGLHKPNLITFCGAHDASCNSSNMAEGSSGGHHPLPRRRGVW